MSDLKPGDYFIQKLFVNDEVVFIYGYFERYMPGGQFTGYIDHNTGVTLDGRMLSEAQHELVGVISKQAYNFAQKQGWPNDQEGVSRVLRYHNRPHGFAGFFHRLAGLLSR